MAGPIEIAVVANHHQLNREVALVNERTNNDLARLIEAGLCKSPIWITNDDHGSMLIATVRLICG